MKVLVVDNSRWWGGAEKNLQTLVDNRSNAIEFNVLSDYPMSHNITYRDFCGVRYRFDNSYFIRYLDNKYQIKGMRIFRLIYKSLYLIPSLVRYNPDIVHFNLYRSSDILDIIVCKILRKKVVLHIRSLANRIKIAPLTIKLADAVICVSKSVKQGFSFTGNKYHVIYNGIDSKYYHLVPQDQAREKLGINLTSFVIGSIGNLEREKGHDVAVKALKKIIDDGNVVVALIIVGKDSTINESETKRILTLSKDLGVQGHIKIFSISHKDIHYVYSACDIVLTLCIDGEAFGMIPLEAAMHNRPVIATNVGACRETIIHNQTGLLCEPNSPVALVQAIDTIMKDKKYCDQLTESARNRVLHKYSADAYRDSVYKIYITITKENKRKL
ncbi:glycosyltransferase family 4 protein [Syntrophus aciditrophicus]|uniref:Glycosyltransferase n=1 Tax=Syntrophus aciditrophicus (strain SB) TaxID=56780 RepID=Q2LPU5_SYNAS|nr:glycosyltransferase family 4 protein [Syntrophus aciditrophicus]ABC76301.1 glycosyltransferase [Syntrophus aciditrophicus SB]